MIPIRFTISGVPDYNVFSNEDGAQVPLLDISAFGASFTFDRPLGASTEVSFSVPRHAGPFDLYTLYGPISEKEVYDSAKLAQTMHKTDTTLVLENSLPNPYGYIHIKTECMQIATSTLAANTNYTVTRGALGTRILPFLVSDNNLTEAFVTNQPCYWKGRMFYIDIKEKGSWIRWYAGLLTQNPILTDNMIQFSGVMLENIVSGDLYNSLAGITTTLSPIIKVGRKVTGYLAARSSISIPRVELVDGSPVGTVNDYDGMVQLVAAARPTNNSKQHLRNICATSYGTKTTTCLVPVTLGTNLGAFYCQASNATYSTTYHIFNLFIQCETVSSDVNIGSVVDVTLPGVCGVYAHGYTNNVIPVTSIDLPYFPDLNGNSPALNNQGQIADGTTEIVQLEKDYYDTSNNSWIRRTASTPYTYKIFKHLGILRRYHTKDTPTSSDYESVRKSFAARDWTWNSDHNCKDFFSYDGSSRFMSYPIRPVTPQKKDDDLLDDFTIFIANNKAKESIQQEINWYSLRVHRDNREGEELSLGAQRRTMCFERAKAFWELGMDFVYLEDDIATPIHGRWFQVKWTEPSGDGNFTDLEGRMLLQRKAYFDHSYTDDQGNQRTGFAYKVLEAKYNRKTPLVGFGTWPSTKPCKLTPYPTIGGSSFLMMEMLCSCEGNYYNDYDLIPVGYNIDPSFIVVPEVMAVTSMFPQCNLMGPVESGSSVAETFITNYLITSLEGLVGKHVYSAKTGWSYKIGTTSMMLETQRSAFAVAGFTDKDILSIPTITRSEDVYSGYTYRFESGEDKLTVNCIDRTAMAEFGANNVMDLDMQNFSWDSDTDPTPECTALSGALHEILGYPYKEITIQVPLHRAQFLNLGDVIDITSDYLDNNPFWQSKNYTGRLMSITHDVKAGVSTLVLSVIDNTTEGWEYSFEMTLDPVYYLQQTGGSGGLNVFAQFLSTNGVTMTFVFDKSPSNPFNGGTLNIDNYTPNAKAIAAQHEFNNDCSVVLVWLDGYNIGAICDLQNFGPNEDSFGMELKNIQPINAANQAYLPWDTTLGNTCKLRFLFLDDTMFFQLNSSEIKL